MHQDTFIRLEHLSKSYQEGEHTRAVLQGVNATFAKGEFVAILGKSGTGKNRKGDPSCRKGSNIR